MANHSDIFVQSPQTKNEHFFRYVCRSVSFHCSYLFGFILNCFLIVSEIWVIKLRKREREREKEEINKKKYSQSAIKAVCNRAKCKQSNRTLVQSFCYGFVIWFNITTQINIVFCSISLNHCSFFSLLLLLLHQSIYLRMRFQRHISRASVVSSRIQQIQWYQVEKSFCCAKTKIKFKLKKNTWTHTNETNKCY